MSVSMSQRPSPTIRFASFELDAASAELRKNGTLIKLQPQPLKVLLLLIQHAGQVVTREEIQQCLWSDSTFVDFERGINFSINQIRAALSDNADSPRFVETLPRRGYRFIAEVAQECSAKEVPSFTGVTAKTGRRRWRIIAAGATAASGFLAFAGFATYRGVFRGPRINFGTLQISKLTDDGNVERLAISRDG